MIHKHYDLEMGKSLDVFDGIFPFGFVLNAYSFCKKSNFSIGWADGGDRNFAKEDEFIHCTFIDGDLEKLGIVEHLQKIPYIVNALSGMVNTKNVLNLSFPTEANFVHTHPEKKVLLYYANTDWADGYHGETMFYSEDRRAVQFCSSYVPGRLIMFDGKIPHTIRPQSPIGPKYRFTLAMLFD